MAWYAKLYNIILSVLRTIFIMSFRKRSCEFGLTYADAQGTVKDMIFEALRLTDLGGCKPDMVMICEEVGENTGKRHYHGYIHYPKRVTAKEDSFDLFGLHCHIDNVKRSNNRKSILPMLKYLTKEDNHPLSTFDWAAMLEEGSTVNKRNEPTWEEYLNEGLFNDEVIPRLIVDGWAAKLANRYFNWAGFIKNVFPTRPNIPYTPNPSFRFILPEELTLWKFQFQGWIDAVLKNHSMQWYRPRSLVLIGPSRSGKTEWARSLGRHMYFNNLLNLDDWDDTVDYIILDDFSSDITKYLPSWKCFFGGQKEFTLTDKYRGKKTVKWGKPMIWLSNEDIFKNLHLEHIEFIKKNCDVIVLNNKLY